MPGAGRFITACGQGAGRGEGGVAVEGRWGFNTHFGTWGSATVMARHTLPYNLRVRGGVRYTSFPAAGADLRPAWFHEFGCGRLVVEGTVSWMRQSRTDNICAGIGAGMELRRWWFMAGWYHRTISAAGYSHTLSEPANLLYDVGVRVLAPESRWNILASLSNSSLLAVERAYQPTLAVRGLWYPGSRTGLWLEAAYKPAGLFNLSHNYYQSSLNIGFEYSW